MPEGVSRPQNPIEEARKKVQQLERDLHTAEQFNPEDVEDLKEGLAAARKELEEFES